MACTISAAEIKRVKALGFLNNKGTDLFNARVITVNGKITAQQTAVVWLRPLGNLAAAK